MKQCSETEKSCSLGDILVNSYEISNPQVVPEKSDSSIIKNVTLRVGGRSLDHFSKCVERTTDVRTLENIPGKVLNECYIDLTLSKLRELDSDREAQDQYILSRSKFLDRGMINVVVVKLRLEEGDILDDRDYGYLNSLLSWKRNDIYMMPILDFGKSIDRVYRLESYESFVTRMIEDRSSWINDNFKIAMSIPDFIPRAYIDRLFNLYSDCDPTFIGVDFNNKRMDKPSEVTGTILNHFNSIGEEKTFMYGINVKPYKRGNDTSAWDIYLTHGSYNAIGPTHTRAHAISAPENWDSMGRIFDEHDISYLRVDDLHRDSFIDWVGNRYDINLDTDFKKNERGLYTYLKRYNFERTNVVLGEFSDAIEKGDSDYIKMMREHIPEEMKNTKILQKTGRRSTGKSS